MPALPSAPRILAPTPRTAPPPLRTVAAAIDGYLAAAFAQQDRAIVATTLAEPRTTEPEAAVRTLDTVAETLAGLALGQVIGAVVAQLRTTLPTRLSPIIDRAVHQATGALGPSWASPLIAVDEGGPARGFVDLLHQRVRRRLLLGAGELRPVLVAIAAAIAAHAPGEERAVVRVLALLSTDALIGDRFGAAVRTGWSCFLAHVEGAPAPTRTPVWVAWARRAGAAPGPRTTTAPRLATGTTPPPTEPSTQLAPGSPALAALGVIVQIG